MKKNLFIWLTVFGLGIISSFSQTAVPGCVDGRIYLKYKPTAIVKYKNPADIDPKALPGMKELIGKYGVNFAEKPYWQAIDDADLQRIYKVGFTSITDVDGLIRDIAANPYVEYAEKVPLCTITYTTNDPSGPNLSSNQWFLNTINAPNAWNIQNGTSTIVVAVVDNAIQRTHTDLSGNIYTNTGEIPGNSLDDDGNGYVDDVNGYDVGDNDNSVLPLNNTWSHGTHTSGLVGARTDNSTGISSIGMNLKILPVKATANSAGSNAVTNGYGGIVYAVRSKARVISCSWGGTVSAASDQSVINYAWSKGVIVICSAGNDANSVLHYPAAYNNVYAVASSGTGNVKSGFSCYGTWVDITSPGESIYSTVPTNAYSNMQGTSMACPIVAGLAGLMLSKNPYLSPTNVLNCISSGAANIYTISGNSAYAPNQLGAGRIEAFNAMTCASVTAGSPPAADFISDKQNTCPLSPIKFTDLSTLYPNAWSWTFQGGSPATSTLANPTVSWTTAGTYSVSLTATNPFGGNTVTKIAYITISNPGSLPLVEGFQGAAWPPANWVDDNKNLDSIKWTRATTCGGYGLSSASLLFDNYYNDAAGMRDCFQMPKLNMSSVSQATLNFDVAFARYDATYSDSLRVMVSTNCGQSWTSIYYKGGTTLATAPDYTANLFVPTNTQWRTESIVITPQAAGQGNVLMMFENHGHYGNGLYIDNVNISYSTTAAPIANYNYPASICSGATMTFTDTSTNTPTSWSWNMPGASVTTSTLQNPSVTYVTGGVYSVTLSATNGVGTSTVSKTFTVTATPTVVAAGSSTACSGTSATLTASGATTYTWNPGSLVGASVVVTPTSTTTYSVVGVTGACSGSTTKVLTISPSPTITASGTSSICSGSSATLSPAGGITYTWNPGALTGSVVVVTPGTTTTYTVTGSNGTCSGSATKIVSVTPGPTVSVNSATICNGSSANLIASGASTYSWNTSATTSSITVSPTTTTTYTVIGTSGSCTDVKTSVVNVNSLPVVTANTSASIICGPPFQGTANITASGASTYTWNTSATTSVIAVSPSVTTSYTVTGTNANGCTNFATFTQSVSACTGIQVLNLDGQLSVLPNPNSGVFTIKVGFEDAYDVTIYNNIGQAVKQDAGLKGDNQIDLSGYAVGIYNIVVNVNGNYKTIKMIIEQ